MSIKSKCQVHKSRSESGYIVPLLHTAIVSPWPVPRLQVQQFLKCLWKAKLVLWMAFLSIFPSWPWMHLWGWSLTTVSTFHRGTFSFQRANGEMFDVAIPSFSLDSHGHGDNPYAFLFWSFTPSVFFYFFCYAHPRAQSAHEQVSCVLLTRLGESVRNVF